MGIHGIYDESEEYAEEMGLAEAVQRAIEECIKERN